ncbi:hypothetical protein C8P63_14615 [Melghirimyces profundicolus]|uniref:ABC transport system permease protein n=1 Tax=Melghirimyces profundicolus TaxID=1242148 RepID=A0A2T6AWY9_9BACL|nr:ABC transporter permease [Melghirimyces profundicolus]PTX48306.1 hypothetical protein C8P63_14615 [Melghirimyces profundicolus]
MEKIKQWQRDGTLWLILLYLLLSILVVSTNYYQIKQQEMNIISRGLYTPTSFAFSLQDSSQPIDWRQLDTKKTFTLFNELDTKKDYKDRAIYFNKDTFIPPMQSGRYFTAADFYKGKRLAVLGKQVGKSVGKEDVFKKNGNEYFRVAGKTFEVIGRMGASYSSDLDKIALINIDAFDRLPNVYVMNTKDETLKQGRALSINQNRIPIQVIDRGDQGAQRYLGLDSYQKGLWITIASIMVVSSLLFNHFWLNKKKTELQILWEHGISIKQVYIHIMLQYLVIVSICYALVCLGSSALFVSLGKINPFFLVDYTLPLLTGYGVILLLSLLSIYLSKGGLLKQIDGKGKSFL